MDRSTQWLELPPITQGIKPNRLLIFLPGESSAELFTPVAIAWQLKFPSAICIILQPPLRNSLWWGKGHSRRDAAPACAREVARNVQHHQQAFGLLASQTALIGFSQGGTVALELARRTRPELDADGTGLDLPVCSIVVAYAAQLARPLSAHESVVCSVHLIHGDLDHRVPSIYGQQAYKSLKAAGADVTLDLLADSTHTIGQDGVIVGTMRAMQSIFRGRRKGQVPTLH